MNRIFIILGVLCVLAGSTQANAQNVFPFFNGMMSGGRTGPNALPNTRQCRDYRRFARIAGTPGTLSKLTRKYNACLNSAPKNATSKRLRCAPGTYVSYVGFVRRCVRR